MGGDELSATFVYEQGLVNMKPHGGGRMGQFQHAGAGGAINEFPGLLNYRQHQQILLVKKPNNLIRMKTQSMCWGVAHLVERPRDPSLAHEQGTVKYACHLSKQRWGRCSRPSSATDRARPVMHENPVSTRKASVAYDLLSK